VRIVVVDTGPPPERQPRQRGRPDARVSLGVLVDRANDVRHEDLHGLLRHLLVPDVPLGSLNVSQDRMCGRRRSGRTADERLHEARAVIRVLEPRPRNRDGEPNSTST